MNLNPKVVFMDAVVNSIEAVYHSKMSEVVVPVNFDAVHKMMWQNRYGPLKRLRQLWVLVGCVHYCLQILL